MRGGQRHRGRDGWNTFYPAQSVTFPSDREDKKSELLRSCQVVLVCSCVPLPAPLVEMHDLHLSFRKELSIAFTISISKWLTIMYSRVFPVLYIRVKLYALHISLYVYKPLHTCMVLLVWIDTLLLIPLKRYRKYTGSVYSSVFFLLSPPPFSLSFSTCYMSLLDENPETK